MGMDTILFFVMAIAVVIVLILFVGKSHVPAANGKPYIKSK